MKSDTDAKRSIMRALLPAAALALGFSGAALADPAVTNAPTYMREAPNSHSPVVQAIPPNAQVDVDQCGAVWCSGSWRGLAGYLRLNALSFDDAPAPPPPPPPPVYDNPPPIVIAPFGFGGGGGGEHRHEWERHDRERHEGDHRDGGGDRGGGRPPAPQNGGGHPPPNAAPQPHNTGGGRNENGGKDWKPQ